MSRLLRRLVLLFRLNEVRLSQFNGRETITLVDLFDLRGRQHLNLTRCLYLIIQFNRSIAMKSEDADLATLLTRMEETTDLLMEALTLARRLLRFPLALPTELGLFNGLGLEELSRSEIIILASITKYLEDLHSSAPLIRRYISEAITRIPDRTSASSSTRTSFMFASMSPAIRRSIPLNKRNLDPPLDFPVP